MVTIRTTSCFKYLSSSSWAAAESSLLQSTTAFNGPEIVRRVLCRRFRLCSIVYLSLWVFSFGEPLCMRSALEQRAQRLLLLRFLRTPIFSVHSRLLGKMILQVTWTRFRYSRQSCIIGSVGKSASEATYLTLASPRYSDAGRKLFTKAICPYKGSICAVQQGFSVRYFCTQVCSNRFFLSYIPPAKVIFHITKKLLKTGKHRSWPSWFLLRSYQPRKIANTGLG